MQKYLKELFYCLAGALIFAYIIYMRLLRDNLPTNLKQNLYAKGNYFFILMYMIFFLIFFFAFIFTLRILLYQKFKLGQLPNGNKISNAFSEIYGKSLESLGLFIIRNTPIKNHLFDILTNFGLYLYKNKWYKGYKFEIILLITHIFPKSIFLGAFIVDVMVFHQFNYVYKVSFVMLIPLIEHSLHYMIKTYSRENLNQVNETIIILNKETKEHIFAEKHSFNIIAKTIDLKIKNPIDPDDCIFTFTEEFYIENKNKAAWDSQKIMDSELDFYFHKLIPILIFNFRYSAKKTWRFMHFNILFFFGFILIWGFMLFYCW